MSEPEDRRAGLMELVEELRQRATECQAVIGVPCQSEYAWHGDEYASWAHRIEVAAALSIPSPVSGWQPIETLPDDYEWQFLTLWTDGKADMMGGMFEYRDILGYGESPATHWMPLPEAPKGPSHV